MKITKKQIILTIAIIAIQIINVILNMVISYYLLKDYQGEFIVYLNEHRAKLTRFAIYSTIPMVLLLLGVYKKYYFYLIGSLIYLATLNILCFPLGIIMYLIEYKKDKDNKNEKKEPKRVSILKTKDVIFMIISIIIAIVIGVLYSIFVFSHGINIFISGITNMSWVSDVTPGGVYNLLGVIFLGMFAVILLLGFAMILVLVYVILLENIIFTLIALITRRVFSFYVVQFSGLVSLTFFNSYVAFKYIKIYRIEKQKRLELEKEQENKEIEETETLNENIDDKTIC